MGILIVVSFVGICWQVIEKKITTSTKERTTAANVNACACANDTDNADAATSSVT